MRLSRYSCTIFEILSLIFHKLKRSRDNVDATFNFVEATFDFDANNGNTVERVYRKISCFQQNKNNETNSTSSICFDFFEKMKFCSTLLPKLATLLPKNDNNVEATFNAVESTKVYDKPVRHCCRFWQQRRMLLRQSRTLFLYCC